MGLGVGGRVHERCFKLVDLKLVNLGWSLSQCVVLAESKTKPRATWAFKELMTQLSQASPFKSDVRGSLRLGKRQACLQNRQSRPQGK